MRDKVTQDILSKMFDVLKTAGITSANSIQGAELKVQMKGGKEYTLSISESNGLIVGEVFECRKGGRPLIIFSESQKF